LSAAKVKLVEPTEVSSDALGRVRIDLPEWVAHPEVARPEVSEFRT
jgi:hypothetical protein